MSQWSAPPVGAATRTAGACWNLFRAWLLFLPLFMSVTAGAHEVRPAILGLNEEQAGQFNVVWKTPMRGGLSLALRPGVSGTLEVLSPVTIRQTGEAAVQTWRLRADGSLRGQTVRIQGLENTKTDVLARIEFADGDVWVHRLTPHASSAGIPARSSVLQVAEVYLKMGIEHILLGIDHLLFILALLLIVCAGATVQSPSGAVRESGHSGVVAGPSGGVLPCGFRILSARNQLCAPARSGVGRWCDRHSGTVRLVQTITAFTVAHSITLGLATLGFLHVPTAPVEAIIALSIVFVAAELVYQRRGQHGVTVRYPWSIAFTFGLLHGLGFAGALSETGLPPGHIPIALLSFNAGVEAGQLCFVAGVLSVVALLSRVRISVPRWMELVPPYAIGVAATFWVFQRVAAF